jgi:hypothetical protein
MQINFSEKQSRQKYLIIILAILVLIAIFILNKDSIISSFKMKTTFEEVFVPEKIEINFEVLKNSLIGDLQLPEKEESFEGEVGRENPFTAY